MLSPVLRDYNLVYIFSRDAHPGLLKIGKASVQAYSLDDITPKMMIDAYIQRYKGAGTLAVTDMHILHIEPATVFDKESNREMNFMDDDVHHVIENSHFEKVIINTPFGEAQEWYKISLEDAKAAIKAFKEGRDTIENANLLEYRRPIIAFREEQDRAIRETIAHFETGDKKLWYAKMRFGKTLCALEVVRKQGYKKTLILTHRPTVRSGWYEDFHKLPFDGYLYGSKEGKSSNQCDAWVVMENGQKVNKYDVEGKDFETLYNGTKPYIYFASMQDLRGSKYIFGEEEKNTKGEQRGFDKNDSVFENDWDLIILDEAHEGTETELGQRVIAKLIESRSPKLLYLSGTPYNILYKFDENQGEIFTWDYVMEQERKNNWDLSKGANPYKGLAQMHIYTYDLHDVYSQNHEIYTDEDFFSFTEFFRVYKEGEKIDGQKTPKELDGKFVHEADVKHFLDLLCDNTIESYYPFSTEALRTALKHTFWLLPGVKQVKALEQLINHHPLHTQYGFHVINVAGDGKSIAEAEAEDDTGWNINAALVKAEKVEKADLAKVKKGVKDHPRTITLSCGRLTTGVTVPEWTGVFMLAGGYKTGAAAYMQTIFRCQSPYINGDIKEHCFAFDFAPDRTLTVVDEYIKMQPIAHRRQFNNPLPDQQVTKEKSNANVESTMRHMPVIAMRGGREIEYNAINFVTDVNRAYTEYFREHGLKGRRLTRDFATFTPADHKLLEEIHKLIGGGSVKMNSDGTLVVAAGGMTGENAEKPKPTSSEKPSTKKTKDGDLKKEKSKKTDESAQRRRSQDVLDQIYIRLPLLIFGAVEDANSVTIEQLLSEEVIDEASWQEFMPTKFTKAIFRQIAHLIKVDALIAYAADIVNEAKNADRLPVEDRILTIAQTIARFHFPDKETVLTPWRVVNLHMTETIGGYNFFNEDYTKLLPNPRFVHTDYTDEIFGDRQTRLLEINSKSGVYPLWLAYSLWRYRCEHEQIIDESDKKTLWADILKNNIFVLCKTPMAVKITHRALAGYDRNITTRCVHQPNLLGILKNADKKTKFAEQLKQYSYWGIENMTTNRIAFNAVVGNPPYQIMDGGGTGDSAKPVYNEFMNIGKAMHPMYLSMIMPSRWLKGGKGLESFRSEMMEDLHIHKLVDFEDYKEIFPTAHIDGGICYLLWNKNHNGQTMYTYKNMGGEIITTERFLKTGDVKTVLRDPRQISIIEKTGTAGKFSVNTSAQKPYGLRADVFNHPERYADICFYDDNAPGRVKLHGVIGNKGGAKRMFKYIDERLVPKNQASIDKYKLFFSKAYTTTATVPPEIIVAGPKEICSETFLEIGPFDNKKYVLNCLTYIKTKFFRFLLLCNRHSLNISQSSFDFVPLQDFTDNSDIDWSQSVADIDKQLYRKYNLSPDEIAFIESMIKPM